MHAASLTTEAQAVDLLTCGQKLVAMLANLQQNDVTNFDLVTSSTISFSVFLRAQGLASKTLKLRARRRFDVHSTEYLQVLFIVNDGNHFCSL